MSDNPLVIPVLPPPSVGDLWVLLSPALAWIAVAVMVGIAVHWFHRRYVIDRRHRRCQCNATGRREMARLDAAALRDLGIGCSEFASYWAEASGAAERTRRRACSCTTNGGDPMP
jgi:hypothetical protein